jgi:hypothetical protein
MVDGVTNSIPIFSIRPPFFLLILIFVFKNDGQKNLFTLPDLTQNAPA